MSTTDLAEHRAVLAELKELHADGWCACQSATLPARVEAALESLIAAAETDWRVLGGLVPGVINAAWLRDGDRVRLNKLEGTVLLHRIINVDHVGRLARFLVQTDIGGHVQYDRALDAEILVLIPAGVNRG